MAQPGNTSPPEIVGKEEMGARLRAERKARKMTLQAARANRPQLRKVRRAGARAGHRHDPHVHAARRLPGRRRPHLRQEQAQRRPRLHHGKLSLPPADGRIPRQEDAADGGPDRFAEGGGV
ncbi:hypothetical protein G6F57_020671 [Rhizopus arrhizus]|nr:hypothetical protein G6F57_020671 [Rhizopus arrhizus]